MSSKSPSKPSSKARMLIFVGTLIIAIAVAMATFNKNARDYSQFTYEIVRSFHHEPDAYTQGLLVHDGTMYESTGQYGESSLRKLDMETGEVLKRIDLPREYFGEGLAYRQGKLYQLTWRAGKLFIYDADTFEKVDERTYEGEGWGLTFDGTHFVMSNGSASLSFRDPETFEEVRSVDVFHRGRSVTNLNELEYIDGKIWANVYTTKDIIIIDPDSGQVEQRYIFRRIPTSEERTGREDAFNGIAHDPQSDRFFVTGKYFSRMYELKMIPKED